MLYRVNTPPDVKAAILQLLQIREVSGFSKYLGLPTVIGKSKKEVFQFVVDKVWRRLQGRRRRLLSRAGKEILLKTVIQAIPTYLMQLFLLPIGTLDTIEKLMNRFWWQHSDSTGPALHWSSWGNMAQPKQQGGLGFRSLRDFNLALVAKQGWRFLSRPSSLVTRIYKARYFPTCSFLDATAGSHPSCMWRSFIHAQDLLRAGCLYRVGRGTAISVFDDPWIPSLPGFRLHLSNSTGQEHLTVADLRRENGWQWNSVKLALFLSPEEVAAVTQIPCFHHDCDDVWTWSADNSGLYTVKSGYRLLMRRLPVTPSLLTLSWRWLRRLDLPKKILNFLWRCLRGFLPVKDRLRSRHIDTDEVCPLCRHQDETICHIFFECVFVRAVWCKSGLPIWVHVQSLQQWLHDVLPLWTLAQQQSGVAILWVIWCSRNALVWHQRRPSAAAVCTVAARLVSEWTTAVAARQVGVLPSSVTSPLHWEPPPEGTLKLNVDSMFQPASGASGAGWILRDHLGLCVGGGICNSGVAASPVIAEAVGLREALSWLKGAIAGHRIAVESDCLELVAAIRGKHNGSYLGGLVFDIHRLLDQFRSIAVSHVRRSANQVAYLLASASGSISGSLLWGSVSPLFISAVMTLDLA